MKMTSLDQSRQQQKMSSEIPTRMCLRCKGEKRLNLFRAPEATLERACWICQGKGFLTMPDEPTLTARALTHTTSDRPALRVTRPALGHKLALSLMNKLGSWDRAPCTVEEAQASWVASPEGRRAFYIWQHLRQLSGLYPARMYGPEIEGTKRHDPYTPELHQIINHIWEIIG